MSIRDIPGIMGIPDCFTMLFHFGDPKKKKEKTQHKGNQQNQTKSTHTHLINTEKQHITQENQQKLTKNQRNPKKPNTTLTSFPQKNNRPHKKPPITKKTKENQGTPLKEGMKEKGRKKEEERKEETRKRRKKGGEEEKKERRKKGKKKKERKKKDKKSQQRNVLSKKEKSGPKNES